MNEENFKARLKHLREEIYENMEQLYDELPKADSMTAAARRARGLTIKLQKLFKEFRKVSCDIGLK